jgi:DNA-binding CsgD family transcriptional regulator/tetratricopeptide (TPR) repeat protein
MTRVQSAPHRGSEHGALVERDLLAERLRLAVKDARGGSGSLIAVSGEAGAGKTALVREVLTPSSSVWGYCEPLATPRPLGPFHDIGREIWPQAGDRRNDSGVAAMRDSLIDWLRGDPMPLVIEDAHWIDDGSAEVLRFLGRRIESTSGLIVVTFRDELDADHPLRRVLGDLATARGVNRMDVPPLSADAVAGLVAGTSVAAEDAYRLTNGNPFLVSQLLQAPDDFVTASVRDAVVARLSRLAPQTRRVVELLSVVPGRVTAALLGDDWTHLDDVGLAGLVDVDGTVVRFRHELVRLAVEHELTPGSARDLHAEVLQRMAGLESVEPATIAFHARRAHDRRRAYDSELAAAERAVALGSHREAVAHLRRAVKDAAPFAADAEIANLWFTISREEHLVGHDRLANEAAQRSLELRRLEDDPVAYGNALRWLSRVTPAESQSHRLAVAAVEILEPLGASGDLAGAYAYLAADRMIARELSVAARWARRAIELAEQFNDVESLVVALQALGVSLTLDGQDPAGEHLRRAIEVCLETGMDFELGRAYANLVAAPGEARLYRVSCAAAEEALAYFVAHDLDGHAGYTRAWHARCLFEQGHWDEAGDLVDGLLDGCFDATANTRIMASYVRARIRARRGDSGMWHALDIAKALADVSGSLQRVAPAASARAEARWLAGQDDDGGDGLLAAYDLALERANPWAIGEIGYWLWRHGLLAELPETAAEPFRLHVNGEPVAAGHAWLAIGCPYEAADAWCDSTDEASVRTALDIFTDLGARPGRRRAARRLRELGVRSIPRGPRDETAADPDGLTAREQEVLRWLRTGHTDAEIASSLHLSIKTVGHHVSAVLRKTGSRSRRELRPRSGQAAER